MSGIYTHTFGFEKDSEDMPKSWHLAHISRNWTLWIVKEKWEKKTLFYIITKIYQANLDQVLVRKQRVLTCATQACQFLPRKMFRFLQILRCLQNNMTRQVNKTNRINHINIFIIRYVQYTSACITIKYPNYFISNRDLNEYIPNFTATFYHLSTAFRLNNSAFILWSEVLPNNVIPAIGTRCTLSGSRSSFWRNLLSLPKDTLP